MVQALFSTFLDFDEYFGIFFALLTLSLSIVSYRTSTFMDNRRLRIFSLGFLLLTVHYIADAILDFYVTNSQMTNGVSFNVVTLPLQIALLVSLVFLAGGLILLFFTSLNTKTQWRVPLLMAIVAIPLLVDSHRVLLIEIISAVLMGFIAYYYYERCRKHTTHQTQMLFFAFLALMAGHVCYTFAMWSITAHLLGHAFEAVGYVLLLIVLIHLWRMRS